MKNITSSVNIYRECARNIWNNYFLNQLTDESMYDLKDEFDDICAMLFSSLVLNGIECDSFIKAKAYEKIQVPLDCLHVIPSSESGIPINVNRELCKSGYWDYPVSLIKPGDIDMRFIDCFDFGQYQFRDFEYYQVRIVNSTCYPDLIGRDALIKASYAEIYFSQEGICQ